MEPSDDPSTGLTIVEFDSAGPRPDQEDFVLTNPDKGFFVVADGFGGPIAGRETARLACESVKEFLEREAGDLEATLPFVLRSYYSLAGNVLFNAILYANQRVLQRNQGKNVHEKGGSSLIAGFLDGDLLAIANVGVCSAYLFRQGQMREIVQSRSLSRLVHPVSLDPVEGFDAPLSALGIYKDLEPEIVEVRLKSGDWVLFQTDGWIESARQQVLSLQTAGYSPTQAAEQIRALTSTYSSPENLAFSLLIYTNH